MTIPPSLATAFLAYLALVAALIAAVLIRFLPARAAGIGVAVLVGWLAYAGILGYSGVVAAQPVGIPGMLILLAPVFAFAAVLVRVVPYLLTLSGGNVEMLIGLSAPAMAWMSRKGDNGRRIAVGRGVCSGHCRSST